MALSHLELATGPTLLAGACKDALPACAREADAEGSAAVSIVLESVTDSARLEVVFLRDTLQVVRISSTLS